MLKQAQEQEKGKVLFLALVLGSLLVLASRLIRALVLAVVSSASGVSVTGEEI